MNQAEQIVLITGGGSGIGLSLACKFLDHGYLAMGLGFGIFWKTLDPVAFMEVFSAEFPYFILPTVLMLLPALVSTIVLVVRFQTTI
ncbi:MAG: hypothetical protein R3D00_27500 [Bacteroidia bacterium]